MKMFSFDFQLDQSVTVFIQLRRPSDGAVSEALPFKFTPEGRNAFWLLCVLESQFDGLAKILIDLDICADIKLKACEQHKHRRNYCCRNSKFFNSKIVSTYVKVVEVGVS